MQYTELLINEHHNQYTHCIHVHDREYPLTNRMGDRGSIKVNAKFLTDTEQTLYGNMIGFFRG